MKLARKIILVLLATFLALAAVLGTFEARRAMSDEDARVRAELVSVALALRPAFLEVRSVEGEARALEMLESANRDDVEPELRFSVAPGEDPAFAGRDLAPLARGELVSFSDGEGPFERMVVVVPAGTGAIEVTNHLADERADVVEVVEKHLVSASLAVLVAALLSTFAGVWIIGRPVRALVEQARLIGQGDWKHPLELARNDELGELAAQMNTTSQLLIAAGERVAREAEARIRAVEQLRHADRLRTVGTLASGMAHELGTPLSVVAGRAKMIASGENAREEDREFARIIQSQAERMTRIMRGLLDFARRTTSSKTPGDLRDVAKRTVDLLAPLAKKRQVELVLAEGARVPAVEMDAAQVEQALANLVVNGIHASHENGKVELSLDVVTATPPAGYEGAAAGPHVRVTVKDHGRGIPPDDLARIFEPFFTTKDVGEGTGLGLAVTHGILSDHGGFIEVESDLGRGTTFSLYFPVARGESA